MNVLRVRFGEQEEWFPAYTNECGTAIVTDELVSVHMHGRLKSIRDRTIQHWAARRREQDLWMDRFFSFGEHLPIGLNALVEDSALSGYKICLSARIFRRRLIRDDDNARAALNKLIVDPLVDRRILLDDDTGALEAVDIVQEKLDDQARERLGIDEGVVVTFTKSALHCRESLTRRVQENS